MDIRKISLYLSGKIPPYEKFSRLEFFDYLEEIFGYSLEKLEFYWKQAREFEEEFYFLVFDMLKSRGGKDELEKRKLEKLIYRLDLPSDIYGNLPLFDYVGLKEEFDQILTKKTGVKSGKSQNKGKQLEVFLEKLFNSINGLEVTEIKEEDDEQIDLVIKNNIDRPFWHSFNSPLILGEAKNWSEKTPAKELSVFESKLGGHHNFSKIGFFIAMNGFTSTTGEKLKRLGATDKILVKITGEDISNLVTKKIDPLDWLESLVTKSFI